MFVKTTFEPPDKALLKTEYESKKEKYSRLKEEIYFSLEQNLKKQEIELHGDIQCRIKEFDSFYSKIIRYEIRDDPFDIIKDVVGIRIICLYRSDLKKIGKLILDNFKIVETDIKSKKISSKEFGYLADHYIVNLSRTCNGPRYDGIKFLQCEIQVKTLLMDAWDSISHHLDYKQEIDIPSKLRRDFYALSGLFYVADTHFELFRDSVKTLKAELQKSVKKDEFDLTQELNLTSLRVYLNSKYKSREKNEEKDYSELLKELIEVGYDNFEKLDYNLDRGYVAVLTSEKEKPPTESGGREKTKYSDVGIVRATLNYVDPNYLNHYLLSWDSPIRKLVLEDIKKMKKRFQLT